MAWANLYNLFEDDKNFYGLLSGALETNVEVTITEFGKVVVTESANDIVQILNGKKLKDIIRSEISEPEWRLTRQGKLALHNMFTINDKYFDQSVIEIDISNWLSSLSKDELQVIADCTFIVWKLCKEVSTCEKPDRHPRWHKDSFWKDNKRRDLLAQEEFFANMGKRRNSYERGL